MATKKRLIDLDKIRPMDFPSVEMDGLDVVRYLNTLPTVDAVEVVHGRWVHHYYDSGERIDDKLYCSECHMCNDHRRTWYCPNCGAKMDEETKFVGICERCEYRDECDWPKLHPKIELKKCPDFNEGEKNKNG